MVAANMHDCRHRRAGGRLSPPLSHRNQPGNQPDVEVGTAPTPPSAPVNTDLEDLLRVLTQRQRLNPRPRLLPFIVNPFSPLLLCDYHYGTEHEPDPDI